MSPPEAYEKMRDKFKKEGLSDKEAKAKAASIYNKNNPDNPVGPGKHEEKNDDAKQLVRESGRILSEN